MRHLAFFVCETSKNDLSLGGLPLQASLDKIQRFFQAALRHDFEQVSYFFEEDREAFPPSAFLSPPFPLRIMEKGMIPPAKELPLVNLGLKFSEKEFLLNLLFQNPDFAISESNIENYMKNLGWVEPDLIIFTGGHRRFKDYLTWSMAYSELFFSPLSWGEFSLEELERAIADFEKRERRFGKVNG
jgi:hypothetical protein